MKKICILLVLLLFCSSIAPAAGEGSLDPAYLAEIELNGSSLILADHYDTISDGNWIRLSGGDPILLPDPFKFSYYGVNQTEYHSESMNIFVDLNLEPGGEGGYYTELAYPYSVHPVYNTGVEGENSVSMDFKGDPVFADRNVSVYLVRASLSEVLDTLADLRAGNMADYNDLFHTCFNEEDYVKYSGVLDENGDLPLDFGTQAAGHHAVLVFLDNTEGDIILLSATAFEVTPYKMTLDSPSTVPQDSTVYIDVDVSGPDGDYTYAAALINKASYGVEVELESDGSRAGTNISVNGNELVTGIDLPAEINSLTDAMGIIGVDTKNTEELINFTADLFGENTQYLKKTGTNSTSLALDLEGIAPGDYVLLAGATKSGAGIAGIAQAEFTIGHDYDGGGGSSSGGGGGSSGGGSVGSSEDQKNVQSKELNQQFVTNGNRIRFAFTQGATHVDYVEFDAKRTAGRITTIVEELKGKSALIPTEPEGQVYKYLNIWVGSDGFATPENIGNAVVGFRVSKDWIAENGIILDSITLQHFDDDKWNSLPTIKISEDEEFFYFEAETPGFSPFAITTDRKKVVIESGEGEVQQSAGTEQSEETGEAETPETAPEEKESNSMTKIMGFFVGFLIVLLIGVAVIQRQKNRNEEKDEKES